MAMKKSTIGTAIMALALVTSFAGGISGTIAWYASSTRATLSYQGTSISQSESLQIGLEFPGEGAPTDAQSAAFAAAVPELLQDENNHRHFWAKAGAGLDPDSIQGYLHYYGYATTELSPITSQAYAENDVLHLKKAPMAYSTQVYDALKYSYCQLNLIFRVSRSGGDVYSKNENIWITDATAAVQSENDEPIYQALRVHLDDNAGKRFIFNPGAGATADAGDTAVAGLLDLNKDGYYDHTGGKEIVYGDYVEKGTAINYPQTFNADSGYEDVNRTGITNPTDNDASTFLAKHYGSGTLGFVKEDLNTDANANAAIHPKLAHYETLKSIIPTDVNGILTGGKPVVATNDDDEAVAHLKATIYLEGWDHSVVDAAINSKFNLGLQFQVDRAVE